MREYKAGDKVRLKSRSGIDDLDEDMWGAEVTLAEYWGLFDFECEEVSRWGINVNMIECLVEDEPEHEWVGRATGSPCTILKYTDKCLIYVKDGDEFATTWRNFKSFSDRVLKKTPQSIEQMKKAAMLL